MYANYDAATGAYTPTGGGSYDAATHTYGQGRSIPTMLPAAIVYLIHYRNYHDSHSLQLARGALRFVLYMQTTTGPNVRVSVDNVLAGTPFEGGAGAQGDSPNPDCLSMESIDVTRSLTAGPHTVTLAYVGGGTVHARVDAILLQPLIEHVVLADDEQQLIGLSRVEYRFSHTATRSPPRTILNRITGRGARPRLPALRTDARRRP